MRFWFSSWFYFLSVYSSLFGDDRDIFGGIEGLLAGKKVVRFVDGFLNNIFTCSCVKLSGYAAYLLNSGGYIWYNYGSW